MARKEGRDLSIDVFLNSYIPEKRIPVSDAKDAFMCISQTNQMFLFTGWVKSTNARDEQRMFCDLFDMVFLYCQWIHPPSFFFLVLWNRIVLWASEKKQK